MKLLWAIYKFFPINNIDLKYSFVRYRKCHKVMMKWRRRALHLTRFTLWHNHMEPTESGCVADCYFIVNVLDLPFASPIAICR